MAVVKKWTLPLAEGINTITWPSNTKVGDNIIVKTAGSTPLRPLWYNGGIAYRDEASSSSTNVYHTAIMGEDGSALYSGFAEITHTEGTGAWFCDYKKRFLYLWVTDYLYAYTRHSASVGLQFLAAADLSVNPTYNWQIAGHNCEGVIECFEGALTMRKINGNWIGRSYSQSGNSAIYPDSGTCNNDFPWVGVSQPGDLPGEYNVILGAASTGAEHGPLYSPYTFPPATPANVVTSLTGYIGGWNEVMMWASFTGGDTADPTPIDDDYTPTYTVAAGGRVKIADNQILNCAGSGIYCSANQALISDNQVSYSGGSGIELNGAQGVNVRGNRATYNTSHGIFLTAAASNNVGGNYCLSNTASGIHLANSSNNTLTGNKCMTNAAGAGINIADADSADNYVFANDLRPDGLTDTGTGTLKTVDNGGVA